MARLFGTDGVRGVANQDLSCELAFQLGRAAAWVLASKTHKPGILVGRDTRISGDMLESALVAGICSVGARAQVVGVVPTPAVAYLTRYYALDAGIMISASHNTVEYNGIKIFDRDGYKLPDALEDHIEAIIRGSGEEIEQPTGISVGRRIRMRNARRDYLDFLRSTLPQRLDGLRIVLDCANGSASDYAPELFTSLGATVLPYFCTPDGTDINDHCGSTHPERLQQLVAEQGADVGLAFDGDADRLIAVDDRGQLVDGDQLMTVCALDMRERGLLKQDTVVSTVMSNLGMKLALDKLGIRNARTAVGDRYVLEHMREHGFNLGGEQSGHIIFLDYNTTGDGMLSALQLLGIMARKKQSLSRLAQVMRVLPQVLLNARVSPEGRRKYQADEEIARAVKALEDELGASGRVLIRPSGTEPLIRVMIEGPDQAQIEKQAYDLVQLIEQRCADEK